MTDLKSYLKEQGVTQVAFADLVGTTSATISRLCSSDLKPSLDLAHRIEVATKGCVPTEVWLDDPACEQAAE